MEADIDFKGAVVVEFGRAVAADRVHFVESLPGQGDDPAGIFAIEGARDAAKGEFPMAISFQRPAS